MSIFKKLGKSIFHALELVGRAKTLAHLETLSDHMLDDLGFSRALMRQGVSAWPWRKDQAVNVTKTSTNAHAIEQAVQELNTYNDRDLDDLGLARGDIRHAVTNGQQGNDHVRAA